VNEAIARLSGNGSEVDISIWAFVVMLTSIIIDFTRSRILLTTAKKYNSQALEADALHFSTDIWSSCVVILGLILVKISQIFSNLSWLRQADSVAALGVSAIVAYVSIQMGIRTVQGLLDTSPAGMDEKVKTIVESVDGVSDCHKVRVRASGPTLFADAHIRVDPRMSISTAHTKTLEIERKVKEQIPGMEITIHVEPLKKTKGTV
jgi:cation diffusion facilitator family transporter